MMTEMAHIFNPADDSLKAKVSTWKKVERSYDNLKKSQARLRKKPHDKAWVNRLGTEQEIAEAAKIIQHSLYKAATSLKQSELKEAQQAGLLSTENIQNIVIAQRQAQMQNRTSNKQSDQSRSR